MAPVVVDDDSKLAGERVDLPVPELRCLDPTVDEDKRGRVVRAVHPHVPETSVGAVER